jgi:uncharacterized alkaline shock family protein YloU
VFWFGAGVKGTDMSDEAEFHADRTQEFYVSAVVPAVPPKHGGAEVIEVAAYRGETKFESEVVEKIASSAARSVPGVVEVGDSTRGVWAKVDGTDVEITVILVISAGEVVADVTAKVRTAVIEAVEHYGLHVSDCTVKVDDIRLPEH